MVWNLDDYFERYEWSMDEVEPGLWTGRFATEWEEDFDLYAMLSAEWLHLAIVPLLPRPSKEAAARLAATLLRLNQRVHLVRFAMDDEGDVCLLADLPALELNYATFQATLDMLVVTTQMFARPLARIAADSHDTPPELADLIER